MMVQYQNPYLANPYLPMYNQGQPVMPQAMQQQPAFQQQQAGVRVSGRTEAMNRLLMMYPANMLVPGFTSDALFDQVLVHEATHALMEEVGINSDIDSIAMQELIAWFTETHAIEVIDAVSSSLGRPVCVSGICR